VLTNSEMVQKKHTRNGSDGSGKADGWCEGGCHLRTDSQREVNFLGKRRALAVVAQDHQTPRATKKRWIGDGARPVSLFARKLPKMHLPGRQLVRVVRLHGRVATKILVSIFVNKEIDSSIILTLLNDDQYRIK